MKLKELLINQRITVQIVFGEHKIEFYSNVIERGESEIFITPYFHNAAPLELNVNGDKGIVCNIFTDDPVTNHRISWKGVELITVSKNNNIVYRIKTHMFNNISNVDERRLHERTLVQVMGTVADGNQKEELKIIIHDISDDGISFYAPETYSPASQQIAIIFNDTIDNKEFDIHLDCAISRIKKENGHNLVGCRIIREDKNYLLYKLLKHLKGKIVNIVNEDAAPENDKKTEENQESENKQSNSEQTENKQTENE